MEAPGTPHGPCLHPRHGMCSCLSLAICPLLCRPLQMEGAGRVAGLRGSVRSEGLGFFPGPAVGGGGGRFPSRRRGVWVLTASGLGVLLSLGIWVWNLGFLFRRRSLTLLLTLVGCLPPIPVVFSPSNMHCILRIERMRCGMFSRKERGQGICAVGNQTAGGCVPCFRGRACSGYPGSKEGLKRPGVSGSSSLLAAFLS